MESMAYGVQWYSPVRDTAVFGGSVKAEGSKIKNLITEVQKDQDLSDGCHNKCHKNSSYLHTNEEECFSKLYGPTSIFRAGAQSRNAVKGHSWHHWKGRKHDYLFDAKSRIVWPLPSKVHFWDGPTNFQVLIICTRDSSRVTVKRQFMQGHGHLFILFI